MIRAWTIVIIATFLIPAFQAKAQLSSDSPPPRVQVIDGAGLDLRSGELVVAGGTITIGAQDNPALSHTFFEFSSGAVRGTPRNGGVYWDCDDGGGGSWCSMNFLRFKIGSNIETAEGGMITYEQSVATESTTEFTLTQRDGTLWRFTKSWARPGYTLEGHPDGSQEVARLSSVTYPSGERLSYVYHNDWPRSITSNLGYQLHFDFSAGQYWPSKATLINLAVDYCDPGATSCTNLSAAWPTVTMNSTSANGPHSATVGGDRTTTTTGWNNLVLTFTRPTGRAITITRLNAASIKTVKTPVGTWSYSYGANTTSTNPAGEVTSISSSSMDAKRVDPLGRITELKLGKTDPNYGSGRPLSGDLGGIIFPSGNRIDWSFDTRFNRTQATVRPTSGSGQTATTTTMHYPASCTATTAKICNQPNYVIDSRGYRTDYTYDPQHGGILTETLPPAANGVRPQTRYTYQQLSAQFKNASGQLIPGSPVWKLVRISSCQTLASCAGTADEVVTEIGYNGNLLPALEKVRSGDNSVLAITTKTYDAIGNVIAIDGPLPGTTDTTRYVWNIHRELIATISPDPDGPGPLPVQVTRTLYNKGSQPMTVDLGTAASQSDAALAQMSVHQRTAIDYDTGGRKTKETVREGTSGPIRKVTQYSYDAASRLQCTAVRMNPAVFSSLPADACASGPTGVHGPDRIAKNIYDKAGQLVQVRHGVGTADEVVYATYSYTPNGNQEYVIDATGNRARFVYDGFDRLQRWYFPSKTKPSNYNPASLTTALSTAGSYNTADFEQYGYDSGGNRTSIKKRDGQTITFGYDALGRMTLKNLPTGSDIYYGYDLSGSQVYARFGSASGQGVSNSYDSFGRLKASTTNLGGVSRTLSYQYDANGNRTRVTHPDGVYFTYDYDLLHRPIKVLENGSLQVASFTYNAKGERANDTRAGVTITYGHDGISRLSSISDNLSGTAHDLTTTYTYNSANQLLARTRNNDAYAFDAYVNVDRQYAVDGRNQYVSAGSHSFCYDSNGNLIGSLGGAGATVYRYDAENRLTEARAAASSACPVVYTGAVKATLSYDPVGRLYQTSAGSLTTRFLFDGDKLVAEYSSTGTLLRRYVHGPGVDSPILLYEGSTVSAANRQSLQADRHGSIVSLAIANGTPLGINSYDEYGIPASSNLGRFQYTGQAWIPELGMYYYKARIYSPSLGRFMQTDPIGYADQINLYSYAQNDPINGTDPTGTQTCTGQVREGNGPGCEPEPEPEEIVVTASRPTDWAAEGASLAVGFTPAGTLADIYSAAMGEDFFTGEPVSGWMRAAVLIPGVSEAAKVLKVGNKIARGHAFAKHVLDKGEFAPLGIRTVDQFAKHVDNIVANPTASKQLRNGRSAYWDEASGTVVILNPNAADGGTAFRPTDGRAYFDRL